MLRSCSEGQKAVKGHMWRNPLSGTCIALGEPCGQSPVETQRQVVATAQVAEQDGQFTGWIDLRSMPGALQQLFAEYEEIVSTQMFSLLDAVEEQRATLHLTGVFEDADLATYL